MNFGKKVWLIGNSSEKSKKTLNKLSKILKAEHFVFDDINPDAFDGKPSFPFAFTQNDAKQIINFLNHHFKNPENFDRIIIHCQAGISRSQAIALFIAKYFYKDSNLYHTLLNQKGKIRGGNQYIYNILQREINKYIIANRIEL